MSEVSFVSGGGGGGLKRSRVYKKSYPARKQAKPTTIMKVEKPLKLNGEYKISRMTSMYIPFGGGGFQIGGASYPGIGFIFDPTQVLAVTTLTGGSIPAAIPNYSEIAALWDRVMIEKVVIEFNTDRTDPTPSATSGCNPILFYAYDKTDIYANTLAITQQQDGCKSFQANANVNSCTTVIYPSYQRIIYYTSLLTSYEPARGYVVSDTAIPHYGFRLAMDTAGVATGGCKLRFTYHYRCKDVK